MLAAMTERQMNFVMAILTDPTNHTAAAKVAGFAEKSAHVEARRLLTKPKIAAAIALGEQLREDRTMITSDRTLHELAIVAFSDITHFEVKPGTNQVRTVQGIPEYMTRAVAQVEFMETEYEDEKGVPRFVRKTKIKLWPKVDALRLLAMYQKLLAGPGGINIMQGNVDQSVHIHQHQHNTWQFGDKKLTF